MEKGIKKWWKRLISPTSEDFRWLRARVLALGASAMAVKGLTELDIIVPDWIGLICNYVIIFAVAVAGTASFTRQPIGFVDELEKPKEDGVEEAK